MTETLIRYAHQNDIEKISTIHVDAWKDTYGDDIPKNVIDFFTKERRKKQWKKFLVNKNNLLLVAEVNNSVVGFLSARSVSEKCAEINCFYIFDRFRGLGVGRKLFSKLIEIIKDHKIYKEIELWVYTKNKYRKFYEKAGGKSGEGKTIDIGDGEIPVVRYSWEI